MSPMTNNTGIHRPDRFSLIRASCALTIAAHRPPRNTPFGRRIDQRIALDLPSPPPDVGPDHERRGMPKFAANLTMLFGEHDFLDRFGAAARAGFRGVEYLFPYEYDKQALKQR